MLLGGDLVFVLRVVVAVIAVLFWPVVGFFVRRRWRRAEARKEEISRLLALASKEAALAELESTGGFGYGYEYSYGDDQGYGDSNGYEETVEVGDQLPEVASVPAPAAVEMHGAMGESQMLLHPCAVCSSLTKARCKQCKAVHYCSGKCQIIHWRQGHKNECRPYSITDHNNDLGVTFHMKVPKEGDNGSFGNDDVEGHYSSKPVERSFGEPALSNSGPPTVHDEKDDREVEHLVAEKGRHPKLESSNSSFNDSYSSTGLGRSHINASHDFDETDQHLPKNRDLENLQTVFAKTEQRRPSVSEHPILVSSIKGSDPLRLSNSSLVEPSSVDVSRKPSALSSLGVSSSRESSLCEPSTSSSGFWEGNIIRNKSRKDATDGSCSSEADESNVSGSRALSSKLTETVKPQVDKSTAKDVALDGSQPFMSEMRKPTNGNSILVEETNGDLLSRKSTKLTPITLRDFGTSGSTIKAMPEPGKLVPRASGLTEKSMTEDNFKASGLSSLSSEKTNPGVESRISSSRKPESRRAESVSSKAFETPLYSNTERHAVQSVKAVMSGNTHGAVACPPQLGGHQQNVKNVSKFSLFKVVDQLKGSTLTKQNAFGTGNEIVAKYKGLFPYELFLKLYQGNKFDFRPCGLINCGNSCYANAVLQCLAFTPPLTAYFLHGLHSKSCQKKDWCFTCEFESLVLKARESTSPLSPIRIISHLQNIGSHLSTGKEEDAHEFLRCAIDAMQSICLKEAGLKECGSVEEDLTLIGLTFGGYLRSKIQCMRCGGKSERHERMMDLTVEIDGDIRTLQEALRQFTRAETLDGDNKYLCGRCKSYEKARKKLKVREAPNVLTIVLKRFQSGDFGKLNKTIKFPEILDMAPYICGKSDKSSNYYRLYGVVVHLDIMNASFSGHYVCYVKNIQDMWFKVDDSTVKPVELETVLTKGAYMLLYARCAPRAPRLHTKSIASRDLKNVKDDSRKSRYPSTSSLGVSLDDSLNGQTCHKCINLNHASSEEDFSSDNNSSFFGSDCSNRDSTSTDDHLDHMTGEMGVYTGRNSSDSETSSSSSSPSPLFSRQSPLADSDRYASDGHGHGFWGRSATGSNREVSDSKKDVRFSFPDSTKQYKNLVSSNSATDANRLGQINPFDKVKSGISFIRSTSERRGNILA